MRSVIKNTIRSRIEGAKLGSAIRLFQLVVPDYESVNSMSIQLARLKKSEKDLLACHITDESYKITLTNISNIILYEVNSLPEDIVLLREKLKTILSDYSVITDTVEVINYIVKDDSVKYQINSLSSRLHNSQQIENQDDQVTWEQDIEEAEQILENIIYNHIHYQTLDFDWERKFIYWLENSQTAYFKISAKELEHEYLSGYYSLIKQIPQHDENYQMKGVLFSWLEKFLVGEFDRAYGILIEVRDQKGISNPLLYEFIAIAFINQESFEKKLKNVLVKGDFKEFKRILFYIERFSESSSEQVTKRTTIYVLEKISRIVQSLYLNIAHNYFQDGTRKGRSKQREIIKRCFEVFIQVSNIQGITEYGPAFENLRTSLAIELDNSGKFPWTEFKNDKLVNTTMFDAVEKRAYLLGTVSNREEHRDKLLAEIKMKITELHKSHKLSEDAVKRFLICCMTAYYNYQDERFVDIIRDLKSGNRISSNLNSDGFIIEKTESISEYELENFLRKFGIATSEVPEETTISITDELFVSRNEYEKGIIQQNSLIKIGAPISQIELDHVDQKKLGYLSDKQFAALSNNGSLANAEKQIDYALKIIALFLVIAFNTVIIFANSHGYISFMCSIFGIIIYGGICVYLSRKAND